MRRWTCGLVAGALLLPAALEAQNGEGPLFAPMDVFGLEWASDPQVSPDGAQVVYVRNFFDEETEAPLRD